MAARDVIRKRLEMQGFLGLDDDALDEVGPWLRWSPAWCTAFMIAGTLLASPWLLWGLAVTAAAGVALPSHPFDYVYNHAVRRLTGTRPLPPNGPPRKFACGLATVWLGATGLAFALGASTLGYALGGALSAAALLVSVTHFCIPSLVYQTLIGRRSAEQARG